MLSNVNSKAGDMSAAPKCAATTQAKEEKGGRGGRKIPSVTLKGNATGWMQALKC